MGYISKTETHWTPYRLPTQVAQNTDAGAGFANLNNLLNNSQSSYAYTTGVTNTRNTALIYCYGYGFDNFIPENAVIKQIDVRYLAQTEDTGAGIVRNKTIKLRTSDNNTNNGWGHDTTPNLTWSFVDGQFYEDDVSKSAIGSADGNTSWGITNVRADHVRNSNFGCVIQGKNDAPTPAIPRFYHAYMRVQYEVTTQIWVEPTFSTNATVSPSTIKADGSSSSTLTVSTTNTNNTSGTLHDIGISCDAGGVISLSDGTRFANKSPRSTSAGQTITDTFTIIGLKAGTGTISVTRAGELVKTVNITVQQGAVAPIYSCTPTLSNSTIKKGASTTLNVVLKNTNNIAGTIPATTISTTGKAKILVNGVQQNTTTINSETFSANGTKTYSFTIVGVVETGSTPENITIQNNAAGTKTVPITVTAPTAQVNITATKAGISFPDIPDVITYSIKNTGEVPAPLTSFVFSVGDPLRLYPNNQTSKTINLNKSLAVGATETVKVDFIGLAAGTGQIIANLTGYSTQTSNAIFAERGVYSSTVTLNNSSIDIGSVFSLKLKYTNTNNTRGLTPETVMNLPAGITTLDGKSTYTFLPVEVAATESVELNVSLVGTTTGAKTITCAGKTVNITIKAIVIPTPVISDNWSYTTKTNLLPTDIGQLVVRYEVVNDVYPAIIPPTTITISGTAVEWNTGGNGSKTITQQTLQTGEIYSNENDNEIYFKFKSAGTSTITLTNSLLGTKNIVIKTQYKGADFVSTASVNTNIVTHVEGGAIINATLENSNVGDTSGLLKGATITLTGGVLQFEDGSTTKVLPDRTIGVSQKIPENILIYTKTDGTGTIRISNEQNNFNYDTLITVEPPLEPEYAISMSCGTPSIPVWSAEEHVSSNLKITYVNTNLLAGNTPELIVYLPSNLKFLNENSSVVIAPQPAGRGETVEYTLLQEIKGMAVGTYTIRLHDPELDEDIGFITLDIRGPTPVNKGWVNLENCEFENNRASNGGAMCNYGKYYSKNLKFKNNTASSKCPNIFDNGVCK